MKILEAEIEINIRFNEIDSMGIVWHGSYAAYFEEAREAFGEKYDLGYLRIFGAGYYVPLVDLNISYKRPLVYGDKIRVKIKYIPMAAAKLVFEYEIYSVETGELCTKGKSVQVFLDKEYALQWNAPVFFQIWKEENE